MVSIPDTPCPYNWEILDLISTPTTRPTSLLLASAETVSSLGLSLGQDLSSLGLEYGIDGQMVM